MTPLKKLELFYRSLKIRKPPDYEQLKFPRQGGQGAENMRKKSRHVHENRIEPQDPRP